MSDLHHEQFNMPLNPKYFGYESSYDIFEFIANFIRNQVHYLEHPSLFRHKFLQFIQHLLILITLPTLLIYNIKQAQTFIDKHAKREISRANRHLWCSGRSDTPDRNKPRGGLPTAAP